MADSRRVALAIAASALVVVAGCGSGSTRIVGGLPLWQRVVQGGELYGYDPQIRPPTTLNLTQFIREATPAFIRITASSARRELTADGFKMATIETFPSGAGNAPVVASTVILVGSHSQAQRVVEWSGNDSLQPCPKTCNAQFDAVKVSGIPDGRGAHRFNLPGTRPFESYDIVYADGPFVYDLFVLGPKPGFVSEKDLIDAARAQYKRVKGAPLPHYLVRRSGGPTPILP